MFNSEYIVLFQPIKKFKFLLRLYGQNELGYHLIC